MKRRALLFAFGLLAACKSPTASQTSQTTTTIAPPSAVASVAPATPESPEHATLRAWNEAHNTSDAKAFTEIYADHVTFYSQGLTNAECVKRKMAALAKSPGYHQEVHGVRFDDATRIFAFTKTTIEHGVRHDYPAYLTLDATKRHVVEEGDHVTDERLRASSSGEFPAGWCESEPGIPNNVVHAPYTTSASKVTIAARKSKHFRELVAQAKPGALLDFGPVRCPSTTGCTGLPGDCGYALRVENHSPDYTNPSNLVEWDTVDAFNVMWWDEYPSDGGTIRRSEQLVP